MFPFGLETVPGVQGCVADATVDVLDACKITPVFKWVNDFNIMHELCGLAMCSNGLFHYFYAYDLADIIRCTDRLDIPWHPIEKKGHGFAFLVTYVGFNWDLDVWAMSLPELKCEKYAARVLAYLNVKKVSLDQAMKMQGMLQHATFILMARSSYLPSLSQAIKSFKGD